MAKLIIKFRCLCFFVRDTATGQVHVVTPATCGCEGGVDKHEPFLIFPKKDGRLNSAAVERKEGEDGVMDFVSMENFAIALPAGSGKPAATYGFNPAVFNLNTVTQRSVSPGIIADARDARITSRLTLPGGRMRDPLSPGLWDFAGGERRLARDVFWTIRGLPDEPFELRRSAFAVGQVPDPEGDDHVATIDPDENGEIRLQFHHTMPGNFAKRLQNREPTVAAQHFRAYYSLYDEPVDSPVPVFRNSLDVGVVGCVMGGGAHP